jgi:hypothetical protein
VIPFQIKIFIAQLIALKIITRGQKLLFLSIKMYHVGKYFESIPQIISNRAFYFKDDVFTIRPFYAKLVWAHVNQRLAGLHDLKVNSPSNLWCRYALSDIRSIVSEILHTSRERHTEGQ